MLETVLEDEPDWREILYVERVELVTQVIPLSVRLWG
jgi:hypothetical protein